MVCDMLDRLPVRYIALDSSPTKAIEARGKGLPVFYGTYVLRNATDVTHYLPFLMNSKHATVCRDMLDFRSSCITCWFYDPDLILS
jgi:hypothetical protein